MTILIAGTIDMPPEKRAAALEAAKPLMARTRAQAGCLDYMWSADPLTPGRIYVYERWESQEALAAHFAGPHYLAMRNEMQSHQLTGLSVLKYRIDHAEPVYDQQGQPRADFFTAKS